MLFVRWVGTLKRNDQIGAISNLNDLVKRESGDKFVLPGGTLVCGPARPAARDSSVEKVLALDPEFTPVLNRLGYAYAMGDMARAEALMQGTLRRCS